MDEAGGELTFGVGVAGGWPGHISNAGIMSKLTIEELIRVLLPILPDAEVTEDRDGQIVIYTGIVAPAEEA